MRYNTDNGRFEAYQGGSWLDILTSGASNIDWDAIVDSMTLDADTDVTMGSFDLSFNNGSALFIDGTNDWVGIGTNAPSNALHILSANNSSGGLKFESSLGTVADRLAMYSEGNSSFVIQKLNSNAVLQFMSSSGAQEMVIDNNGDVGIGTAADMRFHVEDNTAATNSVTNVARLTSTSTGTPAAGIGVGMEFEVETTAGNEVIAGIEAVTTNVGSGTEAGDLVFKTMTGGTAADEAMRITGDGNVGIGTSNALYKLNVEAST